MCIRSLVPRRTRANKSEGPRVSLGTRLVYTHLTETLNQRYIATLNNCYRNVLLCLQKEVYVWYRDLPINRLWALEIHGQKTGVGVYTEKPFVRIHTDHTIIKKLGGRLLGRIRYI